MDQVTTQTKTLLSSQPIYTAQKELFGFELFFRQEQFPDKNENGNVSSIGSLDLCHGIANSIGLFSQKVFINLSESLLLSDIFLPVPTGSVVIELPPSIQVEEGFIDRLKKWKKAGFSFSLDYCNVGFYDPSILEYLHYIKVDASSDSAKNIFLETIESYGGTLTWIVERVETEKQLIKFKKLGFSLFQGYFLAKTHAENSTEMTKNINNSIALITTVSHPRLEINQLTQVICSNAILTSQILKVVNSPLYSFVRPIKSIKDAIVYLGLIQVRKWIIMMTLFNDAMTHSGTIHLILTRAKACENYAESTLLIKSDQAFLTGLLSGADLLFGVKPADFLDQIPTPLFIENAVLFEKGPLGDILSQVKQVEYEILQNSMALTQKKNGVYAAYHHASDWACCGSIQSSSFKGGIVCTPKGGVEWVDSFRHSSRDGLTIH